MSSSQQSNLTSGQQSGLTQQRQIRPNPNPNPLPAYIDSEAFDELARGELTIDKLANYTMTELDILKEIVFDKHKQVFLMAKPNSQYWSKLGSLEEAKEALSPKLVEPFKALFDHTVVEEIQRNFSLREDEKKTIKAVIRYIVKNTSSPQVRRNLAGAICDRAPRVDSGLAQKSFCSGYSPDLGPDIKFMLPVRNGLADTRRNQLYPGDFKHLYLYEYIDLDFPDSDSYDKAFTPIDLDHDIIPDDPNYYLIIHNFVNSLFSDTDENGYFRFSEEEIETTRAQIVAELHANGQLGPYTPENVVFNSEQLDWIDYEIKSRLTQAQPDRLSHAELLQLIIGQSLSLGNDKNQLFVCFGSGSNGKSLLWSLIRKVMGNQMVEATRGTLNSGKINSPGGPSPHLAKLQGKRIMTISETASEDVIDEPLFKSMTGGDPITARGLYEKEVEFTIQATPFMLTNEMPKFKASDACKRRLFFILFPNKFVVNPDPNNYLERKLDSTMTSRFEQPQYQSALLAWMLRGAEKYYKNYYRTGKELPFPEEWRAKLDDVMEDGDHIVKFFNSLNRIAGAKATGGQIYRVYRGWCGENNIKALANNEFPARFNNLCSANRIEIRKPGGVVTYKGISLE